MEPRFSKYLWAFCGATFIGLLAVLLLNLLVDPLGGYSSFALPQLKAYRSEIVSRPAKAELAARGGFDTLIIGSSRMRVGIPTRYPAYGAARVCNLGLGGTTLTETSGVLDFALRHNPVKRVIFGADFHNFSDARSIDPTYEASRFNPHLDVMEYHGRNLLGSRATAESWTLFWHWLRGKTPPAGEDGFVPKFLPNKSSQRDLFSKRIRASLITPGAEGGFVRSTERLELFRAMVRRCRREGIELIVFVPPVHALQLETIHVAGRWPDFEQWQRDLVNILAEEGATATVPLWDFTGFTGLVAERVPPEGDRATRMKYFQEVSHFTPALGELALDRMLGVARAGPNDIGFGVRLTPSNIDAHLARQHAERDAYAAANSQEISWVREIARSSKGAVAPSIGDF